MPFVVGLIPMQTYETVRNQQLWQIKVPSSVIRIPMPVVIRMMSTVPLGTNKIEARQEVEEPATVDNHHKIIAPPHEIWKTITQQS